MTRMSRFFIALILFIVMVLFSSCGLEYRYELKQPSENIKKVIIFQSQTIVNLSESEYKTLLMRLQELPCRKYMNDPCCTIEEPYILVEYNDGSTESISASASGYFDGERMRCGWFYFDTEQFSELLES